MTLPYVRLSVALVLFIGGGLLLWLDREWVSPHPRTAVAAKGEDMARERIHAPELEGSVAWLNTDTPLSLAGLRGKIVLLDFWTYCCINCMHLIPDLKKLEAKYTDQLVVIGVHSAKFPNEGESDNIRQAILRYEIEHPVINDREFRVWRQYGPRSWPTLVLIDPDGYVVGGVSGEGNYDLLDNVISQMVIDFRARGRLNETPLQLALEKAKFTTPVLSFPGRVLADPTQDRLFISDSNHNRILVTTKSGKVLDVAGEGTIGAADGVFSSATFNHPQGMALDSEVLYVADTENHLLRQLDLKARTVTTLQITGVADVAAALMADIWPNLEEVRLTTRTLRSGSSRLVVNVQIPAPFKLNPGSPLEYRVEVEGGAPQHDKRTTVKDGHFPLQIPLAIAGETAEVRATISFVYCRDGDEGVCVIKSFRWIVPVKTAKDGDEEVLIDQVLTPELPEQLNNL